MDVLVRAAADVRSGVRRSAVRIRWRFQIYIFVVITVGRCSGGYVFVSVVLLFQDMFRFESEDVIVRRLVGRFRSVIRGCRY